MFYEYFSSKYHWSVSQIDNTDLAILCQYMVTAYKNSDEYKKNRPRYIDEIMGS